MMPKSTDQGALWPSRIQWLSFGSEKSLKSLYGHRQSNGTACDLHSTTVVAISTRNFRIWLGVLSTAERLAVEAEAVIRSSRQSNAAHKFTKRLISVLL